MMRADKLVLRIIAVTQGVFSLLALVMTPVAFNYGGAAANPGWFQLLLGFWLVGILCAIVLFTAGSWPRLFAAAWFATLFGVAVIDVLRGAARLTLAERSLLWVLGGSTTYLVFTSGAQLADAYRRSKDQRRVRRRLGYATAAIAISLIAARLAYVESHTQAALIAKLDSDSETARCTAASQLAARGRASAAALPKLVAALGNTTCTRWGRNVLLDYVDSIGGIDPFLDMLEHGDGPVVRQAVLHLFYRQPAIQNRAPSLVTGYTAGLRSDDSVVRGTSAMGLGLLGPVASPTVPALIGLLNDPAIDVRLSAVNALERLHSLDGLRAALANPDTEVRSSAIAWRSRSALDRSLR